MVQRNTRGTRVTLLRLSFHPGPLPGEPEGRFADVDGVRVRFTDTGEPSETKGDEAPVAVLLHGFGATLDTWAAVAPQLADARRVITLDLKGFGWSGRPEGDYSPDAQARLVLSLLAQRGVSRAALVAHSWGSAVALAAAQRARSLVTRLALYDAWVYEEQLPTFFHWARTEGVGEALFGMFYTARTDERLALAFHDPVHVTRELIQSVEHGLRRPGTVAAALAAVRGQRFEVAERLYGGIDVPTLVMWGREDRVSLLRHGQRLARELPDARLVTYARCGHFPMIEAHAASTRDLTEFLAEGDGPTRTEREGERR